MLEEIGSMLDSLERDQRSRQLRPQHDPHST